MQSQDYLSRLKSGEPAQTEYDELHDASFFSLDATTLVANHKDEWISEMTQFLSTGLPPEHLTLDAKKRLAVWSRNFCLLTNTLYHKGSDGIWRRAVRQFEKDAVLRDAHHGIADGHYAGDATT